MSRLSVAVMHVKDDPRRRAMLMDLERSLGGSASIRRYVDRYQVIEDRNRAGVWPTARRAWMSSAQSSATHHLVLQDDAVAAPDFLAAVHEIIEIAPDIPISFFDMSKAIRDANTAGIHWVSRNSLSTAVALMIPVKHISPALRWIQDNVRPDVPHDDARLSMYFMAHNIPFLYTAPCLVEHAGDGLSLAGHGPLPGNKKRIASDFIGSTSALSVDWSAGLMRPKRGTSHPWSEYVDYLLT